MSISDLLEKGAADVQRVLGCELELCRKGAAAYWRGRGVWVAKRCELAAEGGGAYAREGGHANIRKVACAEAPRVGDRLRVQGSERVYVVTSVVSSWFSPVWAVEAVSAN